MFSMIDCDLRRIKTMSYHECINTDRSPTHLLTARLAIENIAFYIILFYCEVPLKVE